MSVKQIIERGKIVTIATKYMTAHFPGLAQALQYKVVRLSYLHGPNYPFLMSRVRASISTNKLTHCAYRRTQISRFDECVNDPRLIKD
jgi:hypothetical protein